VQTPLFSKKIKILKTKKKNLKTERKKIEKKK